MLFIASILFALTGRFWWSAALLVLGYAGMATSWVIERGGNYRFRGLSVRWGHEPSDTKPLN